MWRWVLGRLVLRKEGFNFLSTRCAVLFLCFILWCSLENRLSKRNERSDIMGTHMGPWGCLGFVFILFCLRSR